MIRKFLTINLTLSILLTGVNRAAAAEYGHGGQLTAVFLTNTPSVRSNAIGGNHASAEGTAPDLFSNPASLMALAAPEFVASHTQSIENIKQDGVVFGAANGRNAVGGFIDYIDKGQAVQSTIDSNGTITESGEFRYRTLYGGLAAAHRFHRHRFGITAKAWQDSLGTTTEQGWAVDAGYQSPRARSGLNAGFALQNLGPSIHGHDLPRILSFSSSFLCGVLSPKLQGLQLFQSVLFPLRQDTDAISGVEYDRRFFALRFGYHWRNAAALDAASNIALGASVRIKGLNVDYAYRPIGILGDEHRFSVTVRFGLTAAERQHAALELDRAMNKRITDRSDELRGQGLEAAQHGDWEKAVELLQGSIEWNPDNAAATSDLKRAKGQLNFVTGKKYIEEAKKFAREGAWLEAAHQCRQALKLIPNDPDAKKLLAQSEQTIAQSQRDNNGIVDEDGFSKGVQYFLQGKYDAALTQWSQLKSPDNKNQLVRDFINKAKQAKLEQRIVNLESSIKEKSDEVTRLQQRAYTFYSLGQIDMAINNWRKILEIDPNNSEARRSLRDAENRQRLNQDSNSNEALTRRIKTLDQQALQAYSDGDVKTAVQIWKQAAELDPRNLGIQKNLKRAQSELGGKEE